jgi:tetratricopeptide (TPR) repeat protein
MATTPQARRALALVKALVGRYAFSLMPGCGAEAGAMSSWLKIHMLLHTRRYAEAEKEIRQALAADVGDADLHRMLGYALCHQGKSTLALAEAQEAIRLNPEDDDNYYCLSVVQLHEGQHKQAEASVLRALELNPDAAENWGLLAGIRVIRERWKDALEAANAGLALDAENDECLNARVRALAALGQYDDADNETAEVLRRNPEDDSAHCNMGWTLLRRGKPDEAAVHFREALRIDPEYEHARDGLIESLRARHGLYALFLRGLLWTERLPLWMSWGLILAFVIGRRVMASYSEGRPYLAFVSFGLLVVWLLFWMWYWAAKPLFTLTLRFNRENRRVLSPDQVAASNWHAGLLILAVVLLLARPVVGLFGSFIGAVLCAALLPAVTAVFDTPAGRPRRWMACYVWFIGLLGLMVVGVRSGWGLIAAIYVLDPRHALLFWAYSFPYLLGGFAVGLMAVGWVKSKIEAAERRREARKYELQMPQNG